jgi:cobalt-zinc-cadmium efflux system membrane fusion protein
MKYASWLISLSIVLSACGSKEAPAPAEPKVEGEKVTFPADSTQSKGLVSKAAEVATEDMLHLSGRVVWDETQTVRIYAPLGGRITKLVAEPGQKVKAGDALAILTSPDFGEAQAEAAKANADFAVAEKAIERARQLSGAGVIADKDLQQSEADFARAAAERNRTAARARAYGGVSANVDQQFALRTPIAGQVVERNANPGQEVRPDQAQPGSPALFVVSDPSRLWVYLDLPEAALSVIKSGMSIDLKAPALGDETLSAKLENVADFIDPSTRTTRARAVIKNSEHKLKAEMFVNADIKINRGEFIRVPTGAVILLGQTQYVFVDDGGGKYHRQKVVAEEAGFGAMRIKSGINSGEKIVTEGALLLQQIISTSGQ